MNSYSEKEKQSSELQGDTDAPPLQPWYFGFKMLPDSAAQLLPIKEEFEVIEPALAFHMESTVKLKGAFSYFGKCDTQSKKKCY